MVNVMLVCAVSLAVLLIGRHVDGLNIINNFNVGREFDELSYSKFDASSHTGNVLLVKLRLLKPSAAKGAVCLDGSVPGYHLHPGFGSGARSWLVHLEGGGWCNTIKSCTFRTKTHVGSSKYMENLIPFTGILSNKSEENPDFYNWNRVKVRYCDGASFAGDGRNEGAHLEFRGQQIWRAVMEELKLEGMGEAKEALLSGCSAGGLASILHCDKFRELFFASTRVKCLADAGFFLNSIDVSGTRTLQKFFHEVVNLQGVGRNLPRSCMEQMDPTLCFFPENLIASIKTPLFLLNTAYDTWQVLESLAPNSADPYGQWSECKLNYANCSGNQLQFLQDFRSHMVNAVRKFSTSRQNGLFINSCFAHCQSERQDTWFSIDSPLLHNKPIARAVGEWYFDRAEIKYIDCPYPCDQTCHNMVFKH